LIAPASKHRIDFNADSAEESEREPAGKLPLHPSSCTTYFVSELPPTKKRKKTSPGVPAQQAAQREEEEEEYDDFSQVDDGDANEDRENDASAPRYLDQEVQR
jgi:hypothetical protein